MKLWMPVGSNWLIQWSQLIYLSTHMVTHFLWQEQLTCNHWAEILLLPVKEQEEMVVRKEFSVLSSWPFLFIGEQEGRLVGTHSEVPFCRSSPQRLPTEAGTGARPSSLLGRSHSRKQSLAQTFFFFAILFVWYFLPFAVSFLTYISAIFDNAFPKPLT